MSCGSSSDLLLLVVVMAVRPYAGQTMSAQPQVHAVHHELRAAEIYIPTSDAYQYLHKQIVIRLVHVCVMMINAVPAAKGISDQFAPRKIVTGRRLNLKHIKADLVTTSRLQLMR